MASSIAPLRSDKADLHSVTNEPLSPSSIRPEHTVPRQQRARGQHWTAASFIFVQHLVALWTFFYYPAVPFSVKLATIISAWLNLLGITAGYHRLWSHRAFAAKTPLRVFLAIIGLTSFQGSIKWWVMRHRLHHRFTDTELDPYDSTRGFWYSHIGWLFSKPPHFNKMALISSKDLDEDPVVDLQKRYILWGYIIFGALLPAWIGYLLCGDAWAGALWIGGIARCISWHCIFSINSFSHWKGHKEYSDTISAVHVPFINLFQNGEGHHNYHHEFPHDWRHGIRTFDWDPTKWCISLWAKMGLVSDLRSADSNCVLQRRLLVLENEVRRQRSHVKYGPRDEDLPRMTYQEYQRQVQQHHLAWIKIGDYVHDVTDLELELSHPGGIHLLKLYYGKDATKAFEGGLNAHTAAAHLLAAMYRVARIVDKY